ncbi:hypothetical protein FSP39_003488 [Pinctada imbricata]|uniref:FAS1 domain-containing protein n=1 Tax=Pinctada imbricata TaxID=66713 RepID=A0AA88XZ11_PINIB|nr:hypothetical protein FSP39_003488 [Pinctada imbricata]
MQTLFESTTSAKFTVFAFNDTAYNSMGFTERQKFQSMTLSEKANYVKFCTIYGQTLQTSSMSDNQFFQSMASDGNKIFINRRQRTNFNPSGNFGFTTFYVNGAEILPDAKDIVATNGVIHGLGQVIFISSSKGALGYAEQPEDTTIRTSKFFELTKSLTGEFYGTLVQLSNRNNLVTLMIPDDAAMNKIPAAKLDQLKSNPRELDRVIRSHFIKDRVVFTSYVNHNEGFTSALGQPMTFRKPYPWQALVNSFGVSAEIKRGNITVENGVLHIVDQLLGFVYNNIREQITVDGRQLDQLINLGNDEIRQALVQGSGVTVFIPMDSAFDRIRTLPWVNLNSNQTLVDQVLRLHILRANQPIEISTIIGGYESRQFRQTMYKDWMLTIYNERNESWVQGGFVKARVIRPDIKTTNGMVHIIDSVLGIPYLDMAMLICHDLWLLRTYDYLRSIGIKKYITDRRFTSQVCDFEVYGYPPNYDSGNGYQNSQSSCPSNCQTYPNYLSFPCNSPPCNGQSMLSCPTECQQSQYQMTYPCTDMMCTGGTGGNTGSQSSCPSYCTNPAYQTYPQCQQYPCVSSGGGLNPSGQATTQYDMGYCGPAQSPCSITFFVPNSSAIDYFQLRNEGQRIMRDTPRFQFLMKRLMFNDLIYVSRLNDGSHTFKAINGESVRLTKTNQRDVRIYFSGASANVIHMDEGATNGVMHIIDNILFVNEDLTRDISGSYHIMGNTILVLICILILMTMKFRS